MSKKKNANIERNIQKKQERQALHQKLENFIVTHIGVVLILAVLFTVFNSYKNVFTKGMPILFSILGWIGVAVVLAFAVLGTLKKKPALYNWCAVGAANSLIWYFFMYFGNFRGKSYISGVAYSYYAIILYALFCIAYYLLVYNGVWNKKAVRMAFYILVAVVTLAWLATALVFMYLNGAFTGYEIL